MDHVTFTACGISCTVLVQTSDNKMDTKTYDTHTKQKAETVRGPHALTLEESLILATHTM